MERTTKLEQAMADILVMVDGNDGIDSDTIMNALIKKGHDGTIVNDAINKLEESGIIAWVKGQWYLETENTKTQKGVSTMKNEKTENKNQTVSNDERKIIEGIFDGKKELNAMQLGKALSDYFVDPEERKGIREGAVKSGIIVKDGNVYSLPDANDANEKGKTRLQEKNEKRIIALVTLKDAIQVVADMVEGTTLKKSKKSITDLLNAEIKNHLDENAKFVLTEANDIRTKKDFIYHINNQVVPTLNELIEAEKDIQEKDKIVITIDDKAKMIKPDIYMTMEHHDLKEKSRFDTLFNILENQDKKIKELDKLIRCHKDTINLFLNRIQSGNNGNISTNDKTPSKQAAKPRKTHEEIQAENRLSFINSLKGIDKAVFDILTIKKRLHDTDFLIMESLENYTPKIIKTSIEVMVKVGLFESKKQKNTLSYVYTIAPISSFKGKVETPEKTIAKEKKETKTIEKPAKKPGFKRGKKSVAKIVHDTLKDGFHSHDELLNIVINELPERGGENIDKTMHNVKSQINYFLPKKGIMVEKKGDKYSIK